MAFLQALREARQKIYLCPLANYCGIVLKEIFETFLEKIPPIPHYQPGFLVQLNLLFHIANFPFLS